MGKYILFAATKYNCGLISRDSGEWRNTKYVVYSDGTCWTHSKYGEQKPYRKAILPHGMTEQEYRKWGEDLRREKKFRMDAEKFERLQELLETQFDGVQGDWGADGVQWEMHHYGPTGRHLHSPGMCFAEHVPVLKEITELLEQR